MYRQSASLTKSVNIRPMNQASPHERRIRAREENLRRNADAIQLIRSSERANADVASYLTRRLNREVQHYHVSRILTGERRVQHEELEALRELAGAPASAIPATPVLTSTDDVQPLFGYAGGGTQALRLDDSAVIGVAPLHPAQAGSRHTYAFVAFGDSVSTRLQHGDIGYAIRNRTPFRNQLCVVRLKDGEALVKFYDRQDANTLHLYETHPKRTPITVPLRTVEGMDAVVGSTFGAG